MPEPVRLGLGSNEDALRNLARARGALAALAPGIRVLRVTTPRRSNAEGGGVGSYWNQLVECRSELTAPALRAACKEVERLLGRDRAEDAIVAIDIDVLGSHGAESAELRARTYWAAHLGEWGL